jgi:hypothetical protein
MPKPTDKPRAKKPAQKTDTPRVAPKLPLTDSNDRKKIEEANSRKKDAFENAIRALIESCLFDPDKLVRDKAADELLKMGDKRALGFVLGFVLNKILTSDPPYEHSAGILRKLGMSDELIGRIVPERKRNPG